ncbi:MAG: hypothetical protein P8R42_18275 [Candidatus Binatia bacterium]|nr:hypothetical protein [Candidatus Binatia bacterium]
MSYRVFTAQGEKLGEIRLIREWSPLNWNDSATQPTIQGVVENVRSGNKEALAWVAERDHARSDPGMTGCAEEVHRESATRPARRIPRRPAAAENRRRTRACPLREGAEPTARLGAGRRPHSADELDVLLLEDRPERGPIGARGRRGPARGRISFSSHEEPPQPPDMDRFLEKYRSQVRSIPQIRDDYLQLRV